jgi:CheY-like chemotaxis protein
MSLHQDEFFQQVTDVLKHLYDYPYLEKHPLALRYWPGIRQAGPSRAQRLSRFLLESIEALNPPTESSRNTSHAQYYSLLVYRYVEEWPLEGIMRELGYSRRQFFREQRKAIAMLAALLWEKIPSAPLPSAALGAGETDGAGPSAALPSTAPEMDAAEPQAQNPQPGPPSAEPSDLLDAEIGRFLAQRRSVDVTEVVQGVLQVVAHLAEQRDVTLTCDIGPQLPPIYTSRTLIRQVFLRVLSNLITQPDAQQVHLRVHHEEQRVMVELTAEPETPGGQDKTEETPGCGLAHVQRLVKMMGGNWRMGEARSGGCICRFDFPAHSQKILLVVEDNEAVIRAFRRYLAGYDYQVVGTTTGAEAIRLAREVNPITITLDVMMPTQDGWEILQDLKSDSETRHIPVIICSVLEDPELARSLGASVYLRKPVTQFDLLNALDSLSIPSR